MINDLHFYRIAIARPQLKLGDVDANVRDHVEIITACNAKNVACVLFPELSLVGYSCQDLFLSGNFLQRATAGILSLCAQSAQTNTVVICGAPFLFASRIYNCAVVMQHGHILGIVPKTNIPVYREFYEPRWFSSGREIKNRELTLGASNSVPFGSDLLFYVNMFCCFGVEICEDLHSVIPPSSYQTLAGATLIFNLAASNDHGGKSEQRLSLIKAQSKKCTGVYAYASAGTGESSADLVYTGAGVICADGEEQSLTSVKSYAYADIDLERIVTLRNRATNFKHETDKRPFNKIKIANVPLADDVNYTYSKTPFVPPDTSGYCHEVFTCAVQALQRRIKHIKARAVVIGLSGGLDSTLALLIATRVVADIAECEVVAVTIPGLGKTNVQEVQCLTDALSLALTCIDISTVCSTQLQLIGGEGIENVQARQRTLLLLSIANAKNGFMLGTADLSEIALGYSTYGGDHLSMYNINCSIPKTLARAMVRWYGEKIRPDMAEMLKIVVAKPSSPELLPTEKETEKIIGPYILHDFFLYHFLTYQPSFAKMLAISTKIFRADYSASEMEKHLTTFYHRFTANQFKRNCMPDGAKVGPLTLSPRGDWRMPSDIDA